jgi:hypothetical protein
MRILNFVFSLTLIEPGEVKVDLANFDLKLQENFRSTSHFFLNLFLQKRLPDIFELLTWPQKITFKRPFWRFFVRNPTATSPAEPPPFRPVLLFIQTTWAREKSRRAVLRSTVRRQ